MTFLNLGILTAGAVAVAIPVIIHLLMRRRRQPVMWGAMRFIIEAYRATRRRLLVERWLLLATRCLLVLAIAVALGRPILSTLSAPESRGRTVVILIDDSLTAAVERGGTSALDSHKRAAADLIDALAEGDRVGVVSLGAPVQGIVVPPSSDHAVVKRLIESLTPTDARADVPGAMQLARQQLGESDQPAAPGTKLVAILCEWLEGSSDLQGVLPKAPAGVRIAALPPAEGVDTVGITRVSPMREVVLPGDAGDTQTVTVTLQRSGPGAAESRSSTVRVRLAGLDGAAITGEQQATVRFAPGERNASATLALDGGMVATGGPGAAGSGRTAVLVAELTRDALARDDAWRLPIDTRPALKVGVIAERGGALVSSGTAADLTPAQWLLLSLRPTDQQPIDVTELEPTGLDATRTGGLDAVFVLEPQRLDEGAWSRLAGYARAGGLVLVTPPAGASVHSWSDAMMAGLGVPWRIARTAREIDPSDPKRARLSASSVLSTGDAGDLLATIRGELPDLVSAVSIQKVLPPTFATGSAQPGGAPVVESAEPGMTVLLSLDDGTPVVVSARPGAVAGAGARAAESGPMRGAIVYLSCALDMTWTDLPAKPLMVPLMQELLRQGLSRARPALWTVAGVPARLPAGTVDLQAAPLSAGSGLPPTTALGTSVPPLRRAGVLTARDALGVVRAVLAVNPDAVAQRTGAQAPAAVGAWLSTAVADGSDPVVWMAGPDAAGIPGAQNKTVAQLLAARLDGTPSSSWWLVAALALALVEIVLARRVSHAYSGPAPAKGAAHA